VSRLILFLAVSLFGTHVLAAVSLTGTRLIFDGRYAEASLEILNRSDHEVLIQAWLSAPDNVDGSPQASAVDLPFVLTPHLARLEGHGKQVLRVLYQGEGMPQGAESLMHLYVLEIPRRVAGANQLSIAIRQRINVFYRPPGLTDDPAQTPQSLRWTRTSAVLRVSNPTSFHAAIQDVRLDGVAASDYVLLAPGASHEIPVASAVHPARLSFQALTDYGGLRSYCAQAAGDQFNITEDRQKDC
jgi:P pilus assembly chaperone PapD